MIARILFFKNPLFSNAPLPSSAIDTPLMSVHIPDEAVYSITAIPMERIGVVAFAPAISDIYFTKAYACGASIGWSDSMSQRSSDGTPENNAATTIARGTAELYCKPPAYRTISKVLFRFKQHTPKIYSDGLPVYSV